MTPFLSFLSLALPFVAASASSEPCALVTKQIRQAQALNTSKPLIDVPARLAEECLHSMPFYPELAGAFLDEMEKYVEWQSTLEALKNPPPTYLSPPTDILGGLKAIRETEFSSHREFDEAINLLFASAHDAHFAVNLCSFQPFSFQRANLTLVSVSIDGLTAPELYSHTDAPYVGSSVIKVSPVVTINGEDAGSYLEKLASIVQSQDPDARYNSLLHSIPRNPGGFNFGDFYPGSDVTTLGFQNGSTASIQNLARVVDASFDAENGEGVFDLYCRPKPAPDTPEEDEPSPSPEQTKKPLKSGPKGYPEPLIRDPWSQMNGYYLDDDTVVMLIPSFGGPGFPANHSLIFANHATEIVSKALADGRTKIIIDISGNGGGSITRAFDLFKLFFPSEFPYSATRFRRHEALEDIVAILSRANATELGISSPWVYSAQVTPDQESDFESFQDFLGDGTELGVKVTSLFANFNYTAVSAADDHASPIRGFGGQPLNKTQPFKAENILIIGDGMCHSTCTTFVNLMTNVGGVRALPFGGLPDGKPMQIMGGVRGAQSMGFEGIAEAVKDAVIAISEEPEMYDFISEEELKRFAAIIPIPLEEFPLVIYGGNVNLRNAYQEGEDDLPLQFQYQAGDCRLYYTSENILHPETTWKSAKKAIWGNGGCIPGSTGGAGSLADREC